MHPTLDDLAETMAYVRLKSDDHITDDAARELFCRWKASTSMSIGDLFRALEARGRAKAIADCEAAVSALLDVDDAAAETARIPRQEVAA